MAKTGAGYEQAARNLGRKGRGGAPGQGGRAKAGRSDVEAPGRHAMSALGVLMAAGAENVAGVVRLDRLDIEVEASRAAKMNVIDLLVGLVRIGRRIGEDDVRRRLAEIVREPAPRLGPREL